MAGRVTLAHQIKVRVLAMEHEEDNSKNGFIL